jgi:prepilin-type N-terminal cleavage/methylation domain-containing protein
MMVMLQRLFLRRQGFTIVELCVVMVVLGMLAALTYTIVVPRWRERTYYTRMTSEMNTMANGMTLYAAKYNDYPADVTRDIPAEIKEFLQGQYLDTWPDAPYPNSVYDYDNWAPDSNGPEQTYQISMRMCLPGDDAICKANAQRYLNNFVPQSTLNSWDSSSSVYYCIKGSCRAHQNKPMTHPGYCINCGKKSQVF